MMQFGAVSRVTHLFPNDVQGESRAQLALGLRAVVSQHLWPSVQPGEKRHLPLEIMLTNSAIASALRMGKLQSSDNSLQTGRDVGMMPRDEASRRLMSERRIDRQTADRYLSDSGALG